MANQHRTRFDAILKSLEAIALKPSEIPNNLPKIKGYGNLSIFLLKEGDSSMETVMFSDVKLKTVTMGKDFDGVRLQLDAKDNDGDWHNYAITMFKDLTVEFLDGVVYEDG